MFLFKFYLFATLVAIHVLGSLAHAGPNGFYDPKHLWKKTTLRICFGDQAAHLDYAEYDRELFRDGLDHFYEQVSEFRFYPLSITVREGMKSAIQQSYSIAKTGVQFTGFLGCDQDPNADIIIFATHTDHHHFIAASGIGRPTAEGKTKASVRIHSGFYVPDHRSFQHIFRISRLLGNSDPAAVEARVIHDQIQYQTIVHELGHILGLHHEHNRTDGNAENDSIDLSKGKTTSKFYARLTEPEDAFHKHVGPYSLFSTMNIHLRDLFYFARRTQLTCELIRKVNQQTLVTTDAITQELTPLWDALTKNSSALDLHQLEKQMCADETYLRFIPNAPSAKKSYLHASDEETLRLLYGQKRLPLKRSWLDDQKKWIDYINTWPIKFGEYEFYQYR